MVGIEVLLESYRQKNYWKVSKYRLRQEENESATICSQLKLKTEDGKYYNTDVVDYVIALKIKM